MDSYTIIPELQDQANIVIYLGRGGDNEGGGRGRSLKDAISLLMQHLTEYVFGDTHFNRLESIFPKQRASWNTVLSGCKAMVWDLMVKDSALSNDAGDFVVFVVPRHDIGSHISLLDNIFDGVNTLLERIEDDHALLLWYDDSGVVRVAEVGLHADALKEL